MKKSPVTKKRVVLKAKVVAKKVRKASPSRKKTAARVAKSVAPTFRAKKNNFSDVKVMVAVIALLVATGLSVLALPVWAQ